MTKGRAAPSNTGWGACVRGWGLKVRAPAVSEDSHPTATPSPIPTPTSWSTPPPPPSNPIPTPNQIWQQLLIRRTGRINTCWWGRKIHGSRFGTSATPKPNLVASKVDETKQSVLHVALLIHILTAAALKMNSSHISADAHTAAAPEANTSACKIQHALLN